MARMPDFEMPDEPVVDASPDASAPDAVDAAPRDADEQTDRVATPARSRLQAALRRVRVPAAAFLVGVVVAAAGVSWLGASDDRRTRAEVDGILSAYLAGVEDGGPDASLAAALPIGPDALTVLLVEGVTPAELPQVACEEPRIGIGIATVECTVRIDARADDARLVLERIGGVWSLTQGLAAPVRLRTGPLLVEAIGGIPIDDTVARGEQAVWLLPGRYDVTTRTPAQLVVERLDGLVVSPSGGTVRWTSDTSAQLDADVEASALEHVRSCAQVAVDGCPALQQRDPADPFEVFAVVARLRADDPHAMTFEVSIRRPIEQPEEFVVVTVRVDFGEDLDRYDLTAG